MVLSSKHLLIVTEEVSFQYTTRTEPYCDAARKFIKSSDMTSKEFILNWFAENEVFVANNKVEYYYDDTDDDHVLYSPEFSKLYSSEDIEMTNKAYELLIKFRSQHKGEFLTITASKEIIEGFEKVETPFNLINKIRSLPNFNPNYKSPPEVENFDFKVHIESKKPYEYRIQYDPKTDMFLGTALQDGSSMRIVSDGSDPYECLQDLIILHQAKINYENGNSV